MTDRITRRGLLVLAGVLAEEACRSSPRINLPRRPVAPVLSPIPLRDVRLGGWLGGKLDLCIRNRIFAQNPEKLIEPFRHRQERSCWQTEFWGKWFLSAVAACDYTGNHEWRERLARSVRDLLATQSPDGYIGNYAAVSHLKGWDVWGRKYTLLGLLAWYDLSGDPIVLRGARRLADHLLREVGDDGADIVELGLYRGMASSSVLEPIVRLYRATHEERYLRFAEYIVERWSSSKGPQLIEKAGVPVSERFPPPKKWWSWENGQKAYEMMSCYRGLTELYRETGWKPALDSAARTFENIRDREINVAGSGSAEECWYGGAARQPAVAHHQMETCVGVSWMQLCAHLMQLTGDPRFGDEIEKTAYNALAGAMQPDGSSFAQYSALEGVRALGERQCGMDLNCCVTNGPRGMLLVPEVAVMLHADGPVVNLYTEGAWELGLRSGTSCGLEMRTDYPAAGDVEIWIKPVRGASFALRLRIPQWSEETSVTVNGAPIGGVRAGTWAVIERSWTPGDRVRLRLDMRGSVVTSSSGAMRYAAVVRGPLALARDMRMGGQEIDGAVSPIGDAHGRVDLRKVDPRPGMQVVFAAGASEVLLCDYASAGNTWDERSRYRVWMRSG
ncbi:MAG TPA: beta-L-arabinofuranosidase domain-containing protein [Bryobacteraceae bacterium]|nr:beta-L-arabinofuranosidase domain-containing protein [Bryobacteraceae bacterium]